MQSFSRRYGYATNNIQTESMDETLRNRIWSKFYGENFDPYDVHDLDNAITNIERMMDKMGILYHYPNSTMIRQQNAATLQGTLISKNKWYVMYDFLERYLELLDDEEAIVTAQEYNKILEEEASGYRVINGLVTPIISESEMQSIIDASSTPYSAVNVHINKALTLFADRKKPDYENTIKESISAVEALCKIIVGDDSATLGQAVKKLETSGVKMHGAFKSALENLYGYSSDENGIRHAGVDFSNAPLEDARFMLIICSSFVNFIIEKREKSHN